jgi:hypothetical protein
MFHLDDRDEAPTRVNVRCDVEGDLLLRVRLGLTP